MPTIRPKSPVPAEADPSSDAAFASGATGSNSFVIREDSESGDNLSRTGSSRYSLREANDPLTMTLASAKQGTTPELSPLVRSQIEQIAPDYSPKLQQRLAQFELELPNQKPVAGPIMATVGDLVAWLSEQADTVSATLSDDGMLSIVTVFPKDVRLYIEIERDGSIGAAVTRERRYARDISGSTVADLTPEVILAAVESV